MSFFDSKTSDFRLDTTAGGSLGDLEQYIDEIDGLPGPRNLNEVTALGDDGAKFIPGLENVTFTISGHWDDTVTTGPDAILGPLRTATQTLSFEYLPDNVTKYSGECWITEYKITSSVGSQIKFSASFQVDGTITRA